MPTLRFFPRPDGRRLFCYVVALSGWLLAGAAWGQVAPPARPVPYGEGLKFNLSPDGAKYLRLLAWTQVFIRYNENNTNTLRGPSEPKSDQLDVGIRRTRLLLVAQLNPRFLLYVHLGINNQNSVSGGVNPTADGKKPQFFVHEAATEYRVNRYLSLGAGLHYYNGISRLSSPATTSLLTLDLPQTNTPTVDAIDQASRWLGVYAKGRLGKLDYRLSANDPFLTNLPTNATYVSATAAQAGNPLGLGTNNADNTRNTGTNVAQYNPQNDGHVYQGYVSYNFLEPEANLLSQTIGTYLGTRRVLSFGAGFLYNQHGMFSRPTSSVVTLASLLPPAGGSTDLFAAVPTAKHAIQLFGADVFYDAPLDTASRTALTFYGVYYNYDFGPNYVRFLGPENPGYGPVPTRGNAVPQSGTGSSVYGQLGLLLPKNTLGKKARLQPYAAYLLSRYEGLRTSDGAIKGVHVYDAGLNVLLDGHNAKITLNYRARPDFSDVNDVRYRPEITLQTQVFL